MSACAVRTTDPLVVAVASYRGPALGVGEAFDRVLSWADVYHLEQWGPLIGVYDDVPDPAGHGAATAGDETAGDETAATSDPSQASAAVARTGPAAAPIAGSPAGVASGPAAVSGLIRAEAWLPLPPGTVAPLVADADADPHVRMRPVPAETVAWCLHRGYPDGVGGALADLLRWVEEQGLRRSSATHRQVYLQAPKGRPADWEIEVHVPVHRVGVGDAGSRAHAAAGRRT